MNGAPVTDRVISLQNVGIRYRRRTGFMKSRDVWALKDVSFDIYRGETLGIVGRNGAGKSSLLRIIGGIVDPDQGTVTMMPDCRASLLALQVGFIPYLTGRENALLSGMFLGMSRTQATARLPDIIAFSELDEFMDVPVRTYSVGMKARLGFAISLHADPDVLLIDEVLGVGDAYFRKKSTKVMKERIKSNRTVVLVSHNFETLRELCDRLVWIEGGRSAAIGKPDAVLQTYEQSLLKQKGGGDRATGPRDGSPQPDLE